MDEAAGTRLRGMVTLLLIFTLGIVAGASLLCIGQRSVGGRPPRHGDRRPALHGAWSAWPSSWI